MLKVEVDYGNGLIDMGTTAFMSVPYALYSVANDSLIQVVSNLDSALTALTSSITLGCMENTSVNYNQNANLDDGSCIEVGSIYQGGIVFWLDGNGGGLIAAPSDQSTGTEWGCYGTFIGTGTAIGTGAQNTIDIEAGCLTSGIAADICANLTLGGYSDWFLPSKDELNQMYINLHLQGLGGFLVSAGYWSSSEYDSDVAWGQDFDDGYKGDGNKFNASNVRAVRAF